MTPLWFGHMAETHSRIFYNISTSNTRASSSPWKQKKTTRSRSLMLAFQETQTAPYTTTSTESPRTQIGTHIKSSTVRSYNGWQHLWQPSQGTTTHPNYTQTQRLQSQQDQHSKAGSKPRKQGKWSNPLCLSPLSRFDVSQTTTHPPTSRHRCVPLSPQQTPRTYTHPQGQTGP